MAKSKSRARAKYGRGLGHILCAKTYGAKPRRFLGYDARVAGMVTIIGGQLYFVVSKRLRVHNPTEPAARHLVTSTGDMHSAGYKTYLTV